MYSKEVLRYFNNPINIGKIEDADGIGLVENEICSDIIKIYIKVDNDILSDVKFEAKGCPPVIASCCALTRITKGMKISEAMNVDKSCIINELKGLPEEKEHCVILVIKTLHKAINNYR